MSLVLFQSRRNFVSRLAAGLVLSAAALLMPALSSPARADCQPAATPGGTVLCSSIGGTQNTTVGNGTEDGVTVTVQSDATINVAGSSAISLNDGNIVTNNGTITVDGADAIVVNSGNNVVVNNGTIIATGGVNGINAFNGNTIINNGLIRVDDGGVAINVCCDNFVTNTGRIETGDNAVGILAGDRTNITNTGTIRVGSGNAFGILADGDGFIGAGNNATVRNSGTIIGGDFAIGMAAGPNYNIVNTGTITVGDNGTGIQVDGAVAITNSGSIRAGAGGVAVQFNAFGDNTPNTLTNSGRIIGTEGGAAIFGIDNNTVINNGYIQGLVLFVGSGNDLTNNGYIIAGDPGSFTAPSGISIEGTLTNNAAGTFAVRVAPTFNDSFSASGNIQVAGRLLMVITPGLYNTTTTYQQAGGNLAPVQICGCGAGTLSGTFATVASSSPFFTATADYSVANEVDVTITRIGFGSVPGLTPNQRAVGNVLEGGYSTGLTGNAATFYGNILAATSANVLDNLSGQGITGAQAGAFTAGSLFNGAMHNQGLFAPDVGGLNVVIPPPQFAPAAPSRVPAGHEAFASLNKAPAPVQQPGSFRIWTAAFGATQSLQGQADPGSSTQSVRSAGGVIGIDWQTAWDLRVGIAAGGSESSFSVADLQTSGRITGGHIGAYAKKTWDAWYAAASVSYARFSNSTTRMIAGVGDTEAASGRFDSDQFGARFEIGRKHVYAGINVTPFVAVEPAVLWQHGFTETGSTLGLTVDSRTTTSLPTFVGVQVDGRILTPEGGVFAPYSRLSWVHEFMPDRRLSAAFITLPGAGFTVAGARAASDAARLDAGAKLNFRSGVSLFGNFTGEWSARTESYAATGGFRYGW